MGKKYLIDTNVIIDYTRNSFDQKAEAFIEPIFNTDFNISVIVKIETLGFNDVPDKMGLLTEFINTANIIPLNDAITQQTIDLRKVKKLKLADAIIAATALVYNLTIITRNIADFKNIDGITCINPYD
jgi:predicted nucleic acid-binding protein